MIIKILKWALLGILALALGTVALLHLGAHTSLDHDYTHSAAVAALPAFSPSTTDGLVRIAARDYEFRARIAGFGPTANGAEKPAVVLLHGFPVTSAMWTPLIGPLEAVGYRVLAFDQRGYSPGARPREVEKYTVDKLSMDVMAVARAAGLKKFHLVGHDWGAVVGWATVMRRGDHILSWTGLSIPHPAAFYYALQFDPEQKKRSSYFQLFTMPWVPETLFSFNDFQSLTGFAWATMPAQQRDEYLRVFSEPGALTAALNWYRAMSLGPGAGGEVDLDIATPTLFIWGNRDQAVGRVAVETQAQYMLGPYEAVELEAGHWLLVEQPRAVIAAVLEHLLLNTF